MNHKGFGTKKWFCSLPLPTPDSRHGNTGTGGCFSSDCLHPEAKDGGLSQVKCCLPAETDQSLPPTEHSALGTPVFLTSRGWISFTSLTPEQGPAHRPLAGSMGEKEY